MSIVEQITELSELLSQNELERLDLEEFLINKVIRSSKSMLHIKKVAMDRKKSINNLQNKAMEQLLKASDILDSHCQEFKTRPS